MSTSIDSPALAGRILLLDGPGPAALRLTTALAAAGHRVELVHDLAAARHARDRADLLLADAGAGGQDLLTEPATTPLILLDAFGTADQAAAWVRAGAVEVLGRPLPEALLVERVAHHLGRVTYEHLPGRYHFGGLSSSDARMGDVFELARRVADTRTGLLIRGESGTGKTHLARAVHSASARAEAPFVEVNCGAVPTELLASELFGHVKGAFTGADRDRVGRFEAADGGTLFLDEIASASAEMQVKLLRVLESGRFERVGDSKTCEVDVRVLAACNEDLEAEVAAGRFREDLYWRLNVVPIQLPPLRERPVDLLELAERIARDLAVSHDRPTSLGDLDPTVQAVLLAHAWPGNVRELQHRLERAVLLARGDRLDPADLGELFDQGPARLPAPADLSPELAAWLSAPPGPLKRGLDAPERFLIQRALEATGGSRVRTAALLEINRSTLFNKMRRHGLLGPPEPRTPDPSTLPSA